MAETDRFVGQMLGPYQLEARLGSGGMGVVYRAVHTGLQQSRAIKLLPPHLAADTRYAERFRREAMIAADLRHPNIVLIYDVAEHEGIQYIVMDLIEGRSLREVVRAEGPLTVDRATPLLHQLAAALDYAHSRGRLHRDVKPENVMVGSDGHVTLVDFGIAGAVEASTLTRPGTLIGTATYMAPEIVTGQGRGPSADRYALGVVAYEVLTGRVPFDATNATALAYAHVHELPPSPRGIHPDLPEHVERCLLRQLAKDPSQRYPSAAAFVDALAGDEDPDSVPARLDGVTMATASRVLPVDAHESADAEETMVVPGSGTTGSATVADLPPAQQPAPDGRSRRWLVGPGVAIAAVVLTAAFLLFQIRPAGLQLPAALSTPSGSAELTPTTSPNTPVPAKPTAPAAAKQPAATTVPTQAAPATAVAAAPTQPAAPATKPAPPPAATAAQPKPAQAATPETKPAPPPVATAAPPAPTVAPTPRTVLDDRFGPGPRTWPNNPQGTVGYVDGGYRLFGRDPGRHVAVGAPVPGPQGDVVLSGSFRKLSGPSGGGYGLIVRDQGPPPRDGQNQGGRYYVFEVSDLGEWGAWRREVDRWVDLQPWKASPVIRKGLEPNELRLEATGPRFRFLVNGVEMATLEDAALQAGGVGAYLGGDSNEVLLSRFAVEARE